MLWFLGWLPTVLGEAFSADVSEARHACGCGSSAPSTQAPSWPGGGSLCPAGSIRRHSRPWGRTPRGSSGVHQTMAVSRGGFPQAHSWLVGPCGLGSCHLLRQPAAGPRQGLLCSEQLPLGPHPTCSGLRCGPMIPHSPTGVGPGSLSG